MKEEYEEESEAESVDSSKKKKTFKCKVCKKILSQASFTAHMAIHSNKEVHKCHICQNEYGTRKYLQRHVRNIHTEKRHKYKCEECHKTFAFNAKLKAHEMVHTGEKPHSCEVCGKSFRAQYCYKTHMLIHSEEKPYRCAHCPYACRDNSTLRKHQASHTGTAPAYQCTKCDKTYKMKWRLKIHIAEEHMGLNVRLTGCKLCPKMFKTASELSAHVRSVHKRAKVGKCDICGKYLTNVANMTAHLRSHSTLRPFECGHDGCGGRFKTKGDLKRHSIIHNMRRKTPCLQCGRRFARVSALRRHELTQHRLKTKDTPCQRCGVKFYNHKYLLKHIHQKHSALKEHYECDHCGFVTMNKPSIVMHIKHGHGNEKDVKCKICKRKYKRHIYLKMHYLKSHNLRYKPIQRKRKPELRVEVEVKEEPLDIEDHDLDGALENAEIVSAEDIMETFTGASQGSGESEELSEALALSIITDNVASLASLPEKIFDAFFIKHVTKETALQPKNEPDAVEPNQTQDETQPVEATAEVIQERLENRQAPVEGEGSNTAETGTIKHYSYNRSATVISCVICGKECKGLAGYKSHVKTHSRVNKTNNYKPSKMGEKKTNNDTDKRSRPKLNNENLKKFYDTNVKDLGIGFEQFVEICKKVKKDNNDASTSNNLC